MKPQYHVVSSALIAGVLYLFFKSWSMALSCFISGILIDIDHIYDYLREYGMPFMVKKFFTEVYSDNIPRLTLIFHSWELVLLIGIIAWVYNGNPWFAGIFVGLGQHIVLDKLNNGERLRSYSFIWRWKKQFEFEAVFSNLAKKKLKD